MTDYFDNETQLNDWNGFAIQRRSQSRGFFVELSIIDMLDALIDEKKKNDREISETETRKRGNLIPGILLNQIVYWHLPTLKGDDKMTIVIDGKKWIAKTSQDWYNEIRLSVKQVMTALDTLKELELIETKVAKFSGNPTTHIRLVKENFIVAYKKFTFSVYGLWDKTILPNRQKRNSQIGKNEVAYLAKTSIAEITTKTTTEKESLSPQNPPFFGLINEIWQSATGVPVQTTISFQKTWNDIIKKCSENEIESAVRTFLADIWRKDKPAARTSSILFKDSETFIRWVDIYKASKNNVKNKRAPEAEKIQPKTKKKFEKDIQYFIQTNTWQNFLKDHKVGFLIGVGLLKENEKNDKTKINEAEKKALELYK